MKAKLVSRLLIWLFFRRGDSGCVDGPGRWEWLSQKDEGQVIKLANMLYDGPKDG